HMQQEAADRFVSGERHRLHAIALTTITVGEANPAVPTSTSIIVPQYSTLYPSTRHLTRLLSRVPDLVGSIKPWVPLLTGKQAYSRDTPLQPNPSRGSPHLSNRFSPPWGILGRAFFIPHTRIKTYKRRVYDCWDDPGGCSRDFGWLSSTVVCTVGSP